MGNSGNYRGDNDDTYLKGATDDTPIGNVGDRLKVDTEITSTGSGVLPNWNSNLRYEDMNASTGGVARGTGIGGTYTDVYNQTGSGVLAGLLVTLENAKDDWELKLIIDDTEVIFEVLTEDLEQTNIYGFKDDDSHDVHHMGFNFSDNTVRWQGPSAYPITYTSRIQLQARWVGGGNKKFRAGFIARSV